MAQHITKELMSRFTGDRVKIGNKAYQSLFDLSVYSKSKIATSFTLKVSVYETPTSVASHYLHYDMDSTT